MSEEELKRLRKYNKLLQANKGKQDILTREEQVDLKQLLVKWMAEQENGGEP